MSRLARGLVSASGTAARPPAIGQGSRQRAACALIAGALTLSCGGGKSATPADRADSNPLLGTWRAIEYVNVNAADSASRYPFGRPSRGYLVYDATGHVFLAAVRGLTAAPEARGRWMNTDSATLHMLLSGAASYFGTYRVDNSSQTVIHMIEGEIPPNLGATEIATPFHVVSDTLQLGRDSSAHWRFIRLR